MGLSLGCGILAYYQIPGWLPGVLDDCIIVRSAYSGCVRVLRLILAILTLACVRADAGYTHYYIWKQPPDEAALKACVADMNRLIEARKSILVSPDLPESTPGSPKLNSTNVDFNGIGDQACEPFVFPFVFPDRNSFNFCKTQGEPYDEVVTACLIIARDHFPAAVLEIKSDGAWEYWKDGAKLYSSVFGRSARSPLTTGAFPNVPFPNLQVSPARLLFVLFLIFLIFLGPFIWLKRKFGGHDWYR
jgi:hypothetical protein